MGDMADYYRDLMFDVFYGITDGDNDEYYSELVAFCERRGRQCDNLFSSVADTAAAARKDGWQIDRIGEYFEWFCPKCRAAHDFEELEEQA